MLYHIKLLLLITIIAVLNKGACQKQRCVLNLPTFRDIGPRAPALNGNTIQALIPSYVFNCTGVITQWGAAVEKVMPRDVTFQVWRPAITATSQYSLVGSNVFNGVRPTMKTFVLSAPNPRITVSKGDIVGFSYDSPGDWLVQTTTVPEVTVFVRTVAEVNPTLAILTTFTTSVGAPILTVNVEVITSLILPSSAISAASSFDMTAKSQRIETSVTTEGLKTTRHPIVQSSLSTALISDLDSRSLTSSSLLLTNDVQSSLLSHTPLILPSSTTAATTSSHVTVRSQGITTSIVEGTQIASSDDGTQSIFSTVLSSSLDGLPQTPPLPSTDPVQPSPALSDIAIVLIVVGLSVMAAMIALIAVMAAINLKRRKRSYDRL